MLFDLLNQWSIPSAVALSPNLPPFHVYSAGRQPSVCIPIGTIVGVAIAVLIVCVLIPVGACIGVCVCACVGVACFKRKPPSYRQM